MNDQTEIGVAKQASPLVPSTHVTVIICTRDRPLELSQTLETLCSVTIPLNFSVELLVVENGANAAAAPIVMAFRHPQITSRYIHTDTTGKSHALNFAIREATGNILLFTDDDVQVPAHWITEMTLPLVQKVGHVVVGGCKLAAQLNRPWMTDYHRSFLASTNYLSESQPTEFAGVNVACTREVFTIVPRFDEELGGGGLGYCEDSLFARQLKRAGFIFVSRTQVYVVHFPNPERLSYGNWVRAAWCAGRSQAYVMHHWEHAVISWPVPKAILLNMKLRLRRALELLRRCPAEGITAWELSYRLELSKLIHMRLQRARPRNYAQFGYRKSAGMHPRATS